MQRYTYLRWLRSGAAGAVGGEEGAGLAAARATFPVVLRIDGAGEVARDVALHGPGDVVGISPGQIIRRFPDPNSTTADAGAFAHVELDEPDLPWRYTPFHERTAADPPGALRTQGTLTPWLCLVVVRQRDGVRLDYRPGGVLPVLAVEAPAVPAEELPAVADVAAWAHVQLAGDLPADLPAMLAAEPHRSLARLVCPRLLAPNTSYLACLVPVFAAGRQAGLGEPVTATADQRAWAAGDTVVRLPVYDSYAFATGPGGDFEALVRRLRHVHLDDLTDADGNPVRVGRRPLDAGQPGFGLPDRPATVDLFGALCLDGTDLTADPGPIGDDLVAAVDVADAVAPPVYGRWHAAALVPGANAWPTWLTALNRHPGLRATAGQGARLVQERQEEFMAACWEQVGAVVEANQLLRQSQLGQQASGALYRRHVTVLDPPAALQLLGPALSRLRSPADPARTQWADVTASCLPVLALSGHWRRVLRPRGPLVRRVERWLTRDDPRRYDPSGLVTALAAGDRLGPSPAPSPALLVGIAEVVDAMAGRPKWPGATPSDADVAALASALGTLGERRAAPPACTPNPLGDSAAAAVAAVDPAVTVPRRARAQLRLPAGLWDPPDRIDPIMVAPEITTPMYAALAALGQDWLLPGLQHVPQDSVAALAANQAFVEVFLAGMNHEMARELLWRGYPTDQRGTVFRHFWDRRLASGRASRADITRLHTWRATSSLGGHVPRGAGGESFVFLLRGELLRRFPLASVFLVPATVSRGATVPGPVDATAKLPVFSGWLQPDVTFLGFDVPPDEVRGANPQTAAQPGWFVVIQEQPTQPSFGVSAESGTPGADGRYGTWADLGAADLATGANGHLDLAATSTPAFLAKAPAGGPTWDGRADTLAAIFLRRPFRFFLHGSDILGTA